MKKTNKKIKEMKEGSVVEYADIPWIVLSHRKNGTLLISRHTLFNWAFDKKGGANWKESTLREILNDCDFWHSSHSLRHIKKSELIEFDRNLVTYDGFATYGKCKDYVSIISCNEYKRYKNLILDTFDWFWTLTPPNVIQTDKCQIIQTNTCIDSRPTKDSDYSVRPMIMLKNNVEVYELCTE